ncbi:hypothetical protein D3C78_1294100 [compost metagenome]
MVFNIQSIPPLALQQRLPAGKDVFQAQHVCSGMRRMLVVVFPQLDVLELEDHVQTAVLLAHPVFTLLRRSPVHFAHRHDVIAIKHLFAQVIDILQQALIVQMPLERRHVTQPKRIGHVGQPRLLFHMADGVDAETVNALVQPPAHHVVQRRAHLWVFPVQIRLTLREQMKEVLLAAGVIFPGRAVENALPVVGFRAIFTVSPDIPIAFGAGLR